MAKKPTPPSSAPVPSASTHKPQPLTAASVPEVAIHKSKPLEAGIYVEKGYNGYRAVITAPDGKLRDLGFHRNHEDARAAYIAAQHAMYPPSDAASPRGEVVSLTAPDLVVEPPKAKLN